jgi:hypothetical protein
MHIVLQGLGRLDVKLIADDSQLASHYSAISNGAESRMQLKAGLLLEQQITLSYLRVLGAYELVRTLHAILRSPERHVNENVVQRIGDLKHQIERLRVPLAKHVPARRHPTDCPFAWPAFKPERGIAWLVAAETFISRRELSDAILTQLEHVADGAPPVA